MKKLFWTFLSIVLICLSVSAQHVKKPSLQDYAARLKEVKTLTSNFVEEKHLALLSQPMQSTGTLNFDKDAQKLRWQYKTPFENGFLIEKNRISRLKNSQKQPIQNAMGRLMAGQMLQWLTLDFDTLSKTYLITLNGQEIIFTPRDKNNQAVKLITVWLDEKDSRIVHRVKMDNPNGDFVLWRFSDTKLNPQLQDGVFL
ncbi:LolA family protein [Candidatus Avelusimicrobium luingense]|uniref:LolA family protein n=1 Tax=Candidatus Avelusimicrobium luingense TaxID=3416211 RepID=UPI003D128103